MTPAQAAIGPNDAARFSVAPMMEWTDRHCRAFHRCLTKRALLYTEMVTSRAIIYGDRDKLLGYSPIEHPVALQIGGSEPDELASCAKIAQAWGYDEVNLNVGCPSDRVQSGRFGACLMREPEHVADCIAAMQAACSIRVTVKCRLGVDDQDEESALMSMIDGLRAQGIQSVIVHARKAWLKGLSPKQNRDVPPLNYPLVYGLKQRHPDLFVSINGGIANLSEALGHLRHVDGVMLGRVAYHEPALLGSVDRVIFDEACEDISQLEALGLYRPYMAQQLEAGTPLSHMTRHMLGLMHGLRGARKYRQILTVDSIKPGAGLEVLDQAIDAILSAPMPERTHESTHEPLGVQDQA